MAREGSLRGRIVAAYVWLALAMCGLFALVALFAVGEVENFLVERRLEAITNWHFTRPANQEGLPPGLVIHQGEAVPPPLQRLAAGFHEIEDEHGNWYVLAGARSDGTPFVALENVSDFESIEREVMLGLALAIFVSGVLAALIGRLSAGRVIRPVTELADAVQRDALHADTPALAHNDEIGVLARAFAARSSEQKRFLTRERLFTGDVSHELRTPLAVILGAAEVLGARLRGQPDALPAVERIERTARDASARVAALLLLSRAPDALDSTRLELRALLEQEAERCRPLLDGKPVSLAVDAPEPVWALARSELVAMAVGNLLRNACQYTDAGEVAVRLRPAELIVEDSGGGLPEAVREQLFERFVRGDTRAPGSGLGLAIVKRIVEHLGWQIRLDDSPAGGSRFTLNFPPA